MYIDCARCAEKRKIRLKFEMKCICCLRQLHNNAVLQTSRQTVLKDIKLSVVFTHFDSETVIVISVMMCSLWHKMATVVPPRTHTCVSHVNLPSACFSHSATQTSWHAKYVRRTNVYLSCAANILRRANIRTLSASSMSTITILATQTYHRHCTIIRGTRD